MSRSGCMRLRINISQVLGSSGTPATGNDRELIVHVLEPRGLCVAGPAQPGPGCQNPGSSAQRPSHSPWCWPAGWHSGRSCVGHFGPHSWWKPRSLQPARASRGAALSFLPRKRTLHFCLPPIFPLSYYSFNCSLWRKCSFPSQVSIWVDEFKLHTCFLGGLTYKIMHFSCYNLRYKDIEYQR